MDAASGFINRGDWTRIKGVMRRAMEGKTIRIAFLGGSITEGYSASEHEKCYAALTYQWWEKRFPDAKIRYINAGIGGTSSQYGVARAERDVLSELPDLVFIEFSVNDSSEPFFQETYEGLVRQILDKELVKRSGDQVKRRWKPAVMLIHNARYDNGESAENIHLAVGRHYGLPCVSMKPAVYDAIRAGELCRLSVTEDDLHPNDEGHRLLSDVITYALEEICAEAEADYYAKAHLKYREDPLPAPLTKNTYEKATLHQHQNTDAKCEGFQKDVSEKQYEKDCFRGGWRGTKKGDEIIFRFRGSELAVQYRRTINRPALITEAVIDGDTDHSVILDANFNEDWGDGLAITTVMYHGKIMCGQTKAGVSPADYSGSTEVLSGAASYFAKSSEHELRIRILGIPEELGYENLIAEKKDSAAKNAGDITDAGFDLVSVISSEPVVRKNGFPDGFAWGAASSAYQIEGGDAEDGRGRCIWDDFAESGKTADGRNAGTACDHIHRYEEDFRLMRDLGIRNYRFSVSWSRIMPEGTGRVNQKAIDLYRDMILKIKENGITPYLTMYHWELPSALEEKGGWLNPDSVEWFGEYAKVIAESFTDICDYFITLNEPQCFTGLGYHRGVHAPGKKLPLKEVFTLVHNALKAHGTAVINLRKYAKRDILIGYAPTCSVAIPASESAEDIEAARRAYFGFLQDMDNWTWNVAWYSDPVLLGHYPEEGLEKFKEYLPEITEEDMKLIHQPIDFLGQNMYNGYYIRAGKDGKPEQAERPNGDPITASKWPNTPECLYWGLKFVYERYGLPIYITENGVSCADNVAADGHVHDLARIEFLDAYFGQIQRAIEEGVDIRGYFLWTLLDNFEWERGYLERFGIVWVDFASQRRIPKDSALWYQEVIRMNAQNITRNNHPKTLLFIEPQLEERIWGGHRLKTEWGYPSERDDELGECWAVSCNETADCVVNGGWYAGRTLSDLWKNEPGLFGYPEEEEFPLLVKIIDAKEDISIQVHPDDAYAAEHENCKGKRECWYILDCPKDARLVIGSKATSLEELKQLIHDERWSDLLNYVPMKKGDFVQIDPGTLHAITGGVMLLEVQQNSDITYRVYDYDRLKDGKPRQLHLKQSLEVIRTSNVLTQDQVIHTKPGDNDLQELITTPDYKVWTMQVNGEVTMPAHSQSFLIASIVSGSGLIDGQQVSKGIHLIIPYGYPALRLSGEMRVNFAAPV